MAKFRPDPRVSDGFRTGIGDFLVRFVPIWAKFAHEGGLGFMRSENGGAGSFRYVIRITEDDVWIFGARFGPKKGRYSRPSNQPPRETKD